jgi:hypothetical protein
MAETTDTKCPACGEPGARVVETTETYTAPFGRAVEYKQRHTECDACEIEIDVSDPQAFPAAIREAEINSVNEILEYFKATGTSIGRIERALELPHRLISNWKSKESWSKSALALLRIVRAYPWIVEVANKHFRPDVMREKLLEAAYLEKTCYMPAPSTATASNSVKAASISMSGDGADFGSAGLAKMAAAGALAATAAASALIATKHVDLFTPHRGVEVGQELGA